jgi:alkylated DNA repair dioxygenase AlkB
MFTTHDLGDGRTFLTGVLPSELVWDDAAFESVWEARPAAKPTIHLHGRRVEIPRWQRAYGADYHFSGQTMAADPVPDFGTPLLDWAREAVHPGLNGLLLNWYDGPGHYIGPHRDSVRGMVADAPIVTLSFGERRTFRLTRVAETAKETRDFATTHGAAFVLPYATNRAWKHGVPKSARYTGRRISVTMRAFVADDLRPGRLDSSLEDRKEKPQ